MIGSFRFVPVRWDEVRGGTAGETMTCIAIHCRKVAEEHRALAEKAEELMNIFLDGGGTAGGRPYFVMELVKGVPITDYCDQNQVSIRQRLELSVDICQAVQHAHQKGIIHRDPKPSNVLVMSHDGTPAVKVIDFGVAKKAVELAPKDGGHWNTLGVVRYRAGNWKSAVEALNKSREFRKDGDAFDFFFLAMAHWQLVRKTTRSSGTNRRSSGRRKTRRRWRRTRSGPAVSAATTPAQDIAEALAGSA